MSRIYFKRVRVYLFVLLFLGLSIPFAKGATKSYTLNIKANVVTSKVETVDFSKVDGYDRIEIEGLTNYAQPGQPLLPVMTVKYLVPYGKDIDDVVLSWASRKIVPGSYYIEPAQLPMPLSYKGQITPTAPDAAIYNSLATFPVNKYKIVSTQSKRGHKIAIINLYPVEYVPATGQIAYYENMGLNLKLKSANQTTAPALYRGTPQDREVVSEYVDNPDALNSYPENKVSTLALGDDYLIIASSTFVDYAGANNLAVLAAHKLAKWGLTVDIVKTSDIYANPAYAGIDNQEEIRNCIIDYYNNGTQYVLLVGDSDGNFTDTAASGERQAWNNSNRLPHRGLYGDVPGSPASMTPDSNIPSDLYYACLDGTFDNDGDTIYGEITDGPGGGQVDLLAEVYVGRAAVDSTIELDNFVRKTIAYENSQGAYLTKALMVGEQLDAYTYSGDCMDEVENGSSAHGYTTRGLAGTGYFSFSHLYDRNGSWTTAQLIASLNTGVHVINHDGHSTNTTFSKEFSNTDADTLTNTDYFLGFTQGCYSGAFDDRDSEGDYETSDCVLEHFTNESNGAFAFIGNSRYGWYMSGSTDGPSQRFHREFWDAVIYEGQINLGRALQDAKEDNVGLVDEDGAYRWCYFEINLLGDPHTPISGEFLAPTDFSATNIFVGNSSWVNLYWRNSARADNEQTMIRYRKDGVYPTSSTDGTLLCTRSAIPGATDMFNHTAVETGETYHYVVFGYDGSSYEGATAVSNHANVTVIGGGGATSTGRSNCFVATVCYDDENCNQVRTLRKFRDKVLLKSNMGRSFVALYYTFGPDIAQWLKQRYELKNFTRHCLDIVVSYTSLFSGGNE